jgi:hypothetical protein
MADDPLYYLRAIQRRLEEYREAADAVATDDFPVALTLGGQALFDEIDWLDGYIEAININRWGQSHGMYVGRRPDLKGKTALVRPGANPERVLAQFDDVVGLPELGIGWHEYDARDFRLDRKKADC